MEDDEAVRETLAGNTDAYGYLVRSHHRNLYYYVAGRITNDTEAEDVVQKTFVTAYSKLHEYRLDRSFLAWLRGIALNHCRDLWKQHRRQSELLGRLLDMRRAELNLDNFDQLEPGDRVLALRSCMASLSEYEQRVVRLRFAEELPLDAIGVEFNKSAEAVRLLLFRIRKRLEACVRKNLAAGKQAQ